LKAVNDCQALTVSQLITLFWNSPNPAYTRLRQLVKHGYLEQHYITQITAAPAASPSVYTISKQGGVVLAQRFGYTEDELNPISRQIKNWQSYQPIKATNDIRTALMRACWENQEYELASWRNEALFRMSPDMVYINGKPTPVYPDGFCIVTKGDATTYNFVEADSGTEGLTQVASQIRIYLEYTKSGLYEQVFGTKFWRVLFVTHSPRRLENIRNKVVELGGGANFWFTTFDKIGVEQILHQPIWLKTRGQNTYTFI
jgi:hypothetical protein